MWRISVLTKIVLHLDLNITVFDGLLKGVPGPCIRPRYVLTMPLMKLVALEMLLLGTTVSLCRSSLHWEISLCREDIRVAWTYLNLTSIPHLA